MLPQAIFEYVTLTADLVLFVFVGYYLLRLRRKEKELEKKETQADTSYHQIVDDALSKERKIIDDAATEADQIITGANYVKQGSLATVDHALKQLVQDIKKDADTTAQTFTNSYQESLKQLTSESITDFHKVTKQLELELQTQFKNFHDVMLPNLEKELEEYKKNRINQTEQTINQVVQSVSQEILNKSLSLEDHQKLVIESLEKAKKEGVFN